MCVCVCVCVCVCSRGYGKEDYKQFLWFAIRNSLSDNALDIYLAVMWVMFSFVGAV